MGEGLKAEIDLGRGNILQASSLTEIHLKVGENILINITKLVCTGNTFLSDILHC